MWQQILGEVVHLISGSFVKLFTEFSCKRNIKIGLHLQSDHKGKTASCFLTHKAVLQFVSKLRTPHNKSLCPQSQ